MSASRPTYTQSTLVNDRVVGEFMQPIPDPLVRTTVTVGWRDVLRPLLTRRTLTVEVQIGADSDTATRLLELDPDYLGPTGSASRTAWNASLNQRLSDLSQTSTGVDAPPEERAPEVSAQSAATDAGRAADAPGPSSPSTFPSDGA